MRVTVTATRGNPLPWPFAMLFTIVGLVLIADTSTSDDGDDAEVPDELPAPPNDDDPAVVASRSGTEPRVRRARHPGDALTDLRAGRDTAGDVNGR